MNTTLPYSEYQKISREYHEKFRTYNRRKKAFFKRYFKLFHRLEVRGTENIPGGAAIIAPNHAGGYDLDLLAIGYFGHPEREITPMIIDDWHFIGSAWGRYYVGCGILVWTGTGLNYDYLDPLLDSGGSEFPGLVAIFPEGNIPHFSDRNVLGMFHPGAVRMALRYRVPVVPTAMVGFDAACPVLKVLRHEKRPDDIVCLPFTLPLKLVVEYGRPIYLDEFYGMKLSKEEEYWIANEVLRPRLCEVLEKHRHTVIGRVTAATKTPG